MLNENMIAFIDEFPFMKEFFLNNNIPIIDVTIKESIESLDKEYFDLEKLKENIEIYFKEISELLNIETNYFFNSITILPGTDKEGNKENFNELKLSKGDIISIVGKTGSGKSRLLADIEYLAYDDTPTNRRILINDEMPIKDNIYSASNKMVAQLSQNMNFVMDLTVKEFIELHAKSRNLLDVTIEVYNKAIELSGEPFSIDTNITDLSGGQSRSLMIADTAMLSKAPIVLIDEIENAGIDKTKALDLLIRKNKIVLIVTHDPSLALLAQKRIILNNGAIFKVIERTEKELESIKILDEYNKKIDIARNKLRNGLEINLNL